MSRFSDEKRIDPNTYRFLPSLTKDLVQMQVRLKPETHKRIHKLACKLGISYSKAIERMIDTAEAKAMAPEETQTWMDKVAQPMTQGYASYAIFTQPTRKTRKNGKIKGIPKEV